MLSERRLSFYFVAIATAAQYTLRIVELAHPILEAHMDTNRADVPRSEVRLSEETPHSLRTGPYEAPTVPAADAPAAAREAAGRHVLCDESGRGGMGAVFKGRDTELGRELAVKVLLEEHRGRPEFVRRFIEEAQIAGQLQHPGVAPVYEMGRFADDRPFFTMKLVKGHTLAELLAQRDDADADLGRCLGTFAQVCQTLAYTHAHGVIHRDLKPSNVMVGSFGEVQVMDWGLAKLLRRGAEDSAIRTTGTGSAAEDARTGVVGTPGYMAPEQARGEVETVDERADVFGLGAILCTILTGEPAYTGRTPTEGLRQAMRGDTADALARLEGWGADPEMVVLAKDCLGFGA